MKSTPIANIREANASQITHKNSKLPKENVIVLKRHYELEQIKGFLKGLTHRMDMRLRKGNFILRMIIHQTSLEEFLKSTRGV
ncbi:hypothetical protein ACIQAA_05365 [Neobacillus sp. NPDC093182]|uniref:hypothetical protein n=1 Tax=Neobacillus sp. NPDC093182 TaxID=3364297 RepID=UPI003825D278